MYAWFGPAHGWRLLGRGPVSGLVAGPGLAVGVPSVPAPCSQPFPQPGDILLAEDTAGGGHTWRLVDDQPWRRVYVVLADDVTVPFKRAK